MELKRDFTILFQGDSITDAGRDRQLTGIDSLGGGYAMFIAAYLTALRPDLRLNFINKGISGNRVRDLKVRWKEDCTDLKPDIVSILIGINDTWRKYDANDPTTAHDFEVDYWEILKRIREETTAQIMLLEPFVLPIPDDRKEWRGDLDPKIAAVRKLASEFSAVYVPLDGAFASAAAALNMASFAKDGVHPTPAGHALIAREWLRKIIVC